MPFDDLTVACAHPSVPFDRPSLPFAELAMTFASAHVRCAAQAMRFA